MDDLPIVRGARPGRSIVRLRLPMAEVEEAVESLELAAPLHARSATDGCVSLWLGPDQWLVVSDRLDASAMLGRCAAALGNRLHLAVDVSAAWHCTSLEGARVRDLLAMGAGLDWSSRAMPAGRCVRTRFARIAAVLHAVGSQRFDVYVDRSHRDYLDRWLDHAIQDPLLREP